MTTELPVDVHPTFLVVDDDPMVRKLVAHGLKELSPECILEVEDGLQAQQVLRERHVDVVITDVLPRKCRSSRTFGAGSGVNDGPRCNGIHMRLTLQHP